MDTARKRIALLVETSHGSGREILRGIARYARQVGDWQLFHGASGLTDSFPEWMENWDGDAVIARIQNMETLEKLEKLDIPVVDVLGVCENRFPFVHVDDNAIAKLVADHFRTRDFRHFAFYGIAGENWSERRAACFREHCRDAATFHLHETPRAGGGRGTSSFRDLQKWVRELPRPVGMMVASDQRGLGVLEACLSEGISVPEEIAVIGVDNDTALCEIAEPPLSSVRGGHFNVGVQAAHLIDRILGGEDASRKPLLVPPNGIVERESSQIHAIDDPVIANSVRFIRENLSESITNDSIARSVGLSRTLLQKRFREATGQSIREFILARRIERAISLIETTDITLADVAWRCGFRHQEYLGQVVKRATGETPGMLRKAAQG